MNIDPSTTKYLIQARLEAEGIVEKPDVVGAVFGQTEGLLGEELDLRDLQKSGRIGRIEVDAQSKKGRTEGTILIPSSLDQVETSILAAALETIDRVGPCKASIKVDKVEDVRISKRNKIIERARQLLAAMVEESKTSGTDLLDEVRGSVTVAEIVSFGSERLPAGPNVADSDAIIVVEGRGQDRRLDLVQRGRDEDRAFRSAFLALRVDLDAADPAALLEVPQIQFLAQEAFGLAEDRADDVGLLDDALRLEAGLDQVLRGTRIDVHASRSGRRPPLPTSRLSGRLLRPAGHASLLPVREE